MSGAAARLQALERTGLWGTPPEEAFDRAARLAAQLLGVELAWVNLLGERLQFTKSTSAEALWPAGREIELAQSFCVHALATQAPLAIEDARLDARVRATELVAGLGVRAYLGAPLLTREGHMLGTLAAVSRAPRAWAPAQVELLRDLAAGVASEIELRLQLARRAEVEAELRALQAELEARIEERTRALQESTALFGQLAEAVPQVLWLVDVATGRLSYVSPAYRDVWGQEPDALLADPARWLERVHPDDRAAAGCVLEPLAQGAEFTREYRILRPGGEVRWIRDRAFPVRGPQGAVLRIVGIAEDVTERRAREQQLRLLSQAVEQSPASIVITDPQGTIVYVNPAFTRITGYGAAEAIGQNPRILKSGTQPPEFYRGLWQTITAGETWHGEYQNRRKDGSLFWESSVVAPVRDENGAVANYLAIKEDVTQRKALEEQLRQAQKLEAVGQLAGGVAHDFNNILTTILGTAQLALLEEVHPSSLRGDLEQICRAAERAASLVRQLLAFSRKQRLELEEVEVGALVRELGSMLERVIGTHIRLELELAPTRSLVRADATQLQQALTNLVLNARDAMPGGGTLSIRTANLVLGPNGARPPLPPGPYVQLSVQDSGSGMDEQTLARVFEPFFTTREQGRGTGLGLSTVYGIIRQSGGTIQAESQPGRGSTFTLWLPSLPTAPQPPADATPHAPPQPPSPATILLAEDEDAVRALARRILARQGYSVLEARDGAEALDIAREHPGPIPLLLTDLVMPHLSGHALAERLRELRPETKVLFMSGYSSTAHGAAEPPPRGAPFLQKPFDIDSLTRAVHQALTAGAPTPAPPPA